MPVPEISLVVPMYNESEVISLFIERVEPILDSLGLEYEMVFVNDGSSDDTLEKLVHCQEEQSNVKVVDLSRNFGKEIALTAGIDHASGMAVIPIDADLQDPPEIIPEMVEKWKAGSDVVLAVRSDRKADSYLKRKTATWFYSVMERLGEIPIPANAGDFRLMDRKVVDAIRLLPERARFMKGLFAWVGFKRDVVYFKREKRLAGETSWRYWSLWNFALEGIVSFTSAPLKIWSYMGVLTSLVSIIYMCIIFFRTLIFGVDVPGYASLMVVVLFFSGLNLISMGVLGEYISRIFVEVKQRPVYLVQDTYGFKE